MTLLIIFFYLPILYMIIFSFNEGKSLTVFTGFSLRWYKHMLESRDMMEALYTTFSIAILATIISTVVGTIAAIGLSKSKKIIREVMDQVNNLPLMNPEIVTAIGFMLLFITFKVEKGYATMLLAHIAFCIPYVMLSVMPKIRSLDPNLADAAMDLGATPWQALIKVIVPQITPGIFSGALIAFTMSIDDFIISYFVTGSGVKNLSIMVYTMSKRVNPSINAVSTLVVVIITLLLVLINVVPVILAKKAGKSEIGKGKVLVPSIAGIAVLVIGICIVRFGGGTGNLPYEGQTLYVYNWGEYTGEKLIPDFEAATGAKVVMENFDSNEQMYIKVANGEAYDILVPSDYMIQRLLEEDMLQKHVGPQGKSRGPPGEITWACRNWISQRFIVWKILRMLLSVFLMIRRMNIPFPISGEVWVLCTTRPRFLWKIWKRKDSAYSLMKHTRVIFICTILNATAL